MRTTSDGVGPSSGPAADARITFKGLLSYYPRPGWSRAAALVAASLLAACGDERAAADALTVTTQDSAGISITTVSGLAGAELPAWPLSDEPLVTIGGDADEEAHQLHQLSGATRLADGRIAVANGGSHEIRFFAADGRHLATTGGKGGGPGEFEMLGWIGRFAGDSLLAYDWTTRRLTAYGPAGDPAGSTTLAFQAGLRSPEAVGALDDGQVVARPGFDRQFGQGERRDTLPVLLYRRDGGQADTLGVWPGTERFFLRTPQMAAHRGVGFGRDVFVAAGGSRIVVGASDQHQVTLHDATGAVERIVRVAGEAEPVPATAVEEWRNTIRESFERLPPPLSTGLDASAVPARTTYPAFAGLAVDPAGGYWVRDYPRAYTDPARWTVFAADGTPLARVTLPDGAELLEVGADHVLTRSRDAQDVERIEFHALRRTVRETR